MPSYNNSFQKLLRDAGYTGKVRDCMIDYGFSNREDILQFLCTELKRENIVGTEAVDKVHKLESENPAEVEPLSLEETGKYLGNEPEKMGKWDRALEFLIPEVSEAGLESRRERMLESAKEFNRRSRQMEKLKVQLDKAEQENHKTFNRCSEFRNLSECEVTYAEETALQGSQEFDDFVQKYKDALVEFLELIHHKKSKWLFNETDMTRFWDKEARVQQELERLREKLSSKVESGSNPASAREHYSAASPRHPQNDHLNALDGINMESTSVQSDTDNLRFESVLENQPWHSEVQRLNLAFKMGGRDVLVANIRNVREKAKLEQYKQWISDAKKGKLGGVSDMHTETSKMRARIQELKKRRDYLVKDCLPEMHTEEKNSLSLEVQREHYHRMNKKWEALNAKKKKLWYLATKQVARVRLVQLMGQLEHKELECLSPDIQAIQSMLNKTTNIVSSRTRLYPKETPASSKSATHFDESNTFLTQLHKVVGVTGAVVSEAKQAETNGPVKCGPGLSPAVRRLPAASSVTPIRRIAILQERDNLDDEMDITPTKRGLNFGQAMLTTPEHVVSEMVPSLMTPMHKTVQAKSTGDLASVAFLCENLKRLFDLHGSVRKVVVNAATTTLPTTMEVHAKEVGRLYELVFKTRDSKSAVLSTMTLVDNFKALEVMTNELNGEAGKLRNSLKTFLQYLHGDGDMQQHRKMLCSFYLKPKWFVGRVLDKEKEAVELRNRKNEMMMHGFR